MGSPRIAFVGTGANGAGIAADLVRAGHDVTCIEQWPAHVEAMRRYGITVRLPTETQVTPVVPSTCATSRRSASRSTSCSSS